MNITELLNESPCSGEQIAIELGDIVIESIIEEVSEDSILIRLDETALQIIEHVTKLSGSEVQALTEAEYMGRKVSLGKPFLTPDGPKKRSVYVKGPKGKVVKVNFGDKNMRIKKSNPQRRKSFRARHKCDTPGPKWKAKYWSCKFW